MDLPQNSARICELNDAFRRSFVGGVIVVTPNVEELSYEVKTRLLARVRSYEEWNAGNDPYGEHDFGALTIDGAKFFWKIDCYDRSMRQGSEDPSDPEKTTRVLTVMTPEER